MTLPGGGGAFAPFAVWSRPAEGGRPIKLTVIGIVDPRSELDAGLWISQATAAGLGVALAIGFAVMAMAYAVGPISGGHFNPAVTLGMAAAGRFETRLILLVQETSVSFMRQKLWPTAGCSIA